MTFLSKQISALACSAALAAFTGIAVAQHGHDGHDDHGRHDHPNGHFENNDHDRFQQHYHNDAARWANRHDRPHFEQGHAIPRNYRIQPVPRSYWGGTPPPPGYSYGYYDGYVVSYNPTTRIIADILDLATGH